jgi:hypothetical protein
MNINLTDREKDNLIKFWEAFNARNNPLLDDPWTPSFGHYPPTLELREPQPDDHYYQAAGQEPPTESQEGRYPIVGAMSAFILFGGFVVAIWVFLAYFLPWMVNCYLNMTGC